MQGLFLPEDLVIRCLIGFAVGALIGLERQKRMTEELSLGVRSFGLHSLLGTLSAYVFTVSGNPYVLIYAVCISVVLTTVQVVFKLFRTMRKGLTTSLAFAMSFVLGTLVGLDTTPSSAQLIGVLELLAMTVAFLVFLVLSFKEELTAAIASISHEEMISAAEFGVLVLFLWPIMLPIQTVQIGPVAFPLFQTYIIIVILLSIRFTNYIVVKKYKSRGPYFFGFFGGFANSEATASSITDFHNATQEKFPGRMSLAIMLDNIAMVVRNGILVVILDPSLMIFRLYIGPLAIFTVIGTIRIIHERTKRVKPESEDIGVGFASPFSLHVALRFALVFSVVTFLALFLEKSIADWGIIFAAVVGGFATAGAIVTVACASYAVGALALDTAVLAVIIATTTSVLNKVIYVFVGDYNGDRTLTWYVAKDSFVMVVGVVIYILLLQTGFIPIT
ncbi:MAG: hypothetical protein C4K49_11695 [Candidatus Thorarchaeota archaeon]|nr:MAG: hypothetical protein C4K49_11695 [Candidatus Thorarchaeota archaeon]